MTDLSAASAGPLRPRTLGLVAIALLLDGVASLRMADWSHQWLPLPASAAAPYVDDLFALETGIGTFIFLGCVSVIGWTLLFNRAPKYDMDDGDPIEGNLRLEITWTIIPLVIVMLIAWHAIRVSDTLATLGGKVRVTGTAEAMALAEPGGVAAAGGFGPIEVIGRQWSWEFVYPNGVHSTELHLPLNLRSSFHLIATDVIHGFFIPAFRLKQDMIPGSVIDYSLIPTREGRYRLRDSMFSGGYFSSNQTDVVVESEANFQRWLEQAARQPLKPGYNEARLLYEKRLAEGDRGWATVPPAPPPLVHVSTDPAAVHVS
ncbi:cytochrome c oxidase subunit II [Synechococcus sp. CCY9201]|uniref:cytochrome c oxidase subunit II n=1 Tax=unclassified Synechococcus TaxID=2626047 RepID=UPI0018CED783|nr:MULTISPECIES: cytochrome c oxidase subunit II [unclassified Synechococcus]MEA5422762.1 cytochrome c oxidase subunit II [Synechococcus sp. CCY9202]MEA5475381.1 cytochrome c oxidase subunit II [Synechococcus sp. CCY9201]QPN59873.1 cytochrome c oxidase subunit II [Synechococcus sp. CBW1002]QPN66673.1 cytochrome c oxidase subunit II [Synechococcus sp. CBW1006]